MMSTTLANLLKQTLDPGARSKAEEELEKVHKIIGFCPGLLEVVMTDSIEMAVRQAGVIYFKNMVASSWVPAKKRGDDGVPTGIPSAIKPNMTFAVHEQDKAMVRENIVQASVVAPDVIRIQLNVCINMIIKHDFPHKWSEVVDKISIYLQTPEPVHWQGALLVLYQLVKVYEYRKKEDRAPLNDAMNLLLPMIFEIVARSLGDQSQEMTLVKKIILKTYYALTQFVLSLDLINREFFTKWMEVLRQVVEQEIPEGVYGAVEDDDKPQLIWWKQKKWALHLLTRFFERYGSPGNVLPEYKEFGDWYLKTFSQGILTSIFKLLDAYCRGVYVSPRVLQKALSYIGTGVNHAATWKIVKGHIFGVFKDVVFPIMSYTEADQELWETDPYEYVRVKFDIFEGFVSPASAAQSLLYSACKKRKNILPKTMEMLMAIVQDPNSTPSHKDGALRMIGTLASLLLKKEMYRQQMEQFLVSIVFPEFSSLHGHLRARACWMVHHFAAVKFNNTAVLGQAIKLSIDCFLKVNEEVPVKVEGAIAIKMILDHQGDAAKQFVEPQIREITMELLKIIRDTENDDLTSVLQKIVYTYTEQITPVAVDICTHLVDTFAQVLASSESDDEKAVMALGLLNTIEAILSVMEEKEEVQAALEPVVLRAVHHIFTNSIMEFYEEALSLTSDLTSLKISNTMWEVLKLIYQIFERDGIDYFTDMMPTLHNYVTVDTERFLSTPDYPMAMFNMCKKILLDADQGEDPERHAAKLLEVIILQSKGKNIDELIPHFVEVVFVRLSREIKTSELRTMCIQVAIAAMYYNPELFFTVLQNKAAQAGNNQDTSAVIKNFVGQWIHDTDCFIGLHDRKLSVIGLCQLMTMPQLPGIEEYVPRILPSAILLFEGLKHAYEAQREADESDESSEEEDTDNEGCLLDTDEDDIDEDSAVYLEALQEKLQKHSNGTMQLTIEQEEESEDDDDDDDYDYEPSLESYTTPLDDEDTSVDEYQIFQQVMQTLESQNTEWYLKLVSNLSAEDTKSLKEIYTLANQRQAARKSKSIEQAGGYQFIQQTVPGQFNFGSSGTGFSFGKH